MCSLICQSPPSVHHPTQNTNATRNPSRLRQTPWTVLSFPSLLADPESDELSCRKPSGISAWQVETRDVPVTPILYINDVARA